MFNFFNILIRRENIQCLSVLINMNYDEIFIKIFKSSVIATHFKSKIKVLCELMNNLGALNRLSLSPV